MIEICYEWEDEQNRRVLEKIGENIIKRICSSRSQKVESNYLGLRIDEIIWPYLSKKKDFGEEPVCMNLIPLERLGQSQGKSGSKILLCYFECGNMLPSIPMIIKREIKGERSGSKHICQEFENATKIYPFLRRKDIFILPFYKASVEDTEFIVSNSIVYSPDRRIDTTISHIETFMDRLRIFEAEAFSGGDAEKKGEELIETINYLYACLQDLHLGPFASKHNILKENTYFDEYNKYLRGMVDDNVKNKFCYFWCGKVRNSECQECPLFAIEKVVNKKACFHQGCIHGDFHPRNIVYLAATTSSFNDVSIIDYGWSNDLAHIAKDYVLMECNFRFMAISSKISPNRLLKLQKSIETEEITKSIKSCEDTYEREIYKMIECLRSSFIDTISKMQADINQEKIFYEEYIIPLFLVGYGLVKYYGESENQLAHRTMLDELAKYILEKERNMENGKSDGCSGRCN